MGKLASIRFFASMENATEGVYADKWGPATANLCKTGPSILLSVRTSVQHQLRLLASHNPDYLLTYPSNLAALLEHSRQHGVTLPNLKEVRTLGDTVTKELRSACRSAWGVPLTDIYSSQELGYIAYTFPTLTEIRHVFAEFFDEESTFFGDYELGDRCPILVFTAKRGKG